MVFAHGEHFVTLHTTETNRDGTIYMLGLRTPKLF